MITIYGKADCSFCDKAKNLCDEYGLKFTYIDISDSIEALEEFVNAFPSTRTVPQIVWNGRHVGGYTDLAAEIENTGLGNYGQGAF